MNNPLFFSFKKSLHELFHEDFFSIYVLAQ